jgi:hypothetical protein
MMLSTRKNYKRAHQAIDEILHNYLTPFVPSPALLLLQETKGDGTKGIMNKKRKVIKEKIIRNKFAVTADVVQELINFHMVHKTLEMTIPQEEDVGWNTPLKKITKPEIRYTIEELTIIKGELCGFMVSNHGDRIELCWENFLSSNMILWAKDDLLKQVGLYHRYELPNEWALNPDSLTRADTFAVYAKQASLECGPLRAGWTVTLSANWQNIDSLLRLGIPSGNIIHFEQEKHAAALIRILAARENRGIHTVYCPAQNAHGVEDYIIENKFEQVINFKDLEVQRSIVALNLDYCTSFDPALLTRLFSVLPLLKVVSITQSKRGIPNKASKYDEIQFPPNFKEQVKERFDQQRVTSRIWTKKGLKRWTGNVGTSGRFL